MHIGGEISVLEDKVDGKEDVEFGNNVRIHNRNYYVLLFDGVRKKIDDIIDYNGFVMDALDALRMLERERVEKGVRDIVLLYSSSVGMVEFTHSRYFPGTLLKRLSDSVGMEIPDNIVRNVLFVA